MYRAVLAGVFLAACSVAAAAIVPQEKDARTAAQRKIDSQLLYEIYQRRGEAGRKGVPPGPTGIKVDDRGRVFVDVRAEVSDALAKTIDALGGTVVSASSEHRSILARVPILALERLAGDRDVHAIQPAAEAHIHRPPKGGVR